MVAATTGLCKSMIIPIEIDLLFLLCCKFTSVRFIRDVLAVRFAW